MNPINPQTPGPIVAVKHYLHVPALPCPGYEQGACLASVGNITNREGDARLLAASFNAFDKAGRELGIDAAELAERIDLAALIHAARHALAYLDTQPNATPGSIAEVGQCGARYLLRTELAKLSV